MSGLSAHVLDTALGRPARGLRVRLAVRADSGEFEPLSAGMTDDDGRIRDLLASRPLEARIYRLTFETGAYLLAMHGSEFFPEVDITFAVSAAHEHHHVPLLLSPFGYSTYRGS
jgi:5-hydroxyisourate hydrolase